MLNEQAVELAIRVGLALNCTVQRSVFARKNYFYPDQPKNYQISQFDLPINGEGWLELPDGSISFADSVIASDQSYSGGPAATPSHS